MTSLKSWLRPSFVHRARAERRESPALAAFYWVGPALRRLHVGNISSSGAYLLTKERWNSGELLSLTLQRAGVLESCAQRRFTVQAKVTRSDRDGVGVTFLMPRGGDLRLWQSPIKAEVPQTEPEDVVREFRIAAALAFIHRIAPAAVDEANLLLRDSLSNYRLESAVEIVLYAEELLALEGAGSKMSAHSSLVLRILEDGSWAEADWIQHFWAGLLAASCTTGEASRVDLNLPGILSQLTTIQARIFAASCIRAATFVAENNRVFAHALTCSAEEIIKIAGTHDLVHIERDVQHLVDLGLVERRVQWKFFSLIDEADITPTPLAFELYARCQGHRGDIADFYAGSVIADPSLAAN